MLMWNLYICRTAWKLQESGTPLSVWDVATQDRIVARVESLAAKARENQERLDVLSLAGALVYLAPEMRHQSALAVKGRIRGFRGLVDSAEELTFVPAVLASVGLSLIGPPGIVFEKSRLHRIISKAADYEPRGPAVGSLVTYLRHLARRPGNR
jgi:hypothetical protein